MKKSNLLTLFFFSKLCISLTLSPGLTKETSKWMPNGIPIDPSGNIYAVPFPKIDLGTFKSLTKPKLSANVGGNFQIINLSKEGDVFYSDIEEFESGNLPMMDQAFLSSINIPGTPWPGLSKAFKAFSSLCRSFYQDHAGVLLHSCPPRRTL